MSSLQPAVSKLTDEERNTLLQPLLKNGWNLCPDQDACYREFDFNSFTSVMGFLTLVSFKAEKLDHHPEWTNKHTHVYMKWSTHDANGLTKRDISMMNYINSLKLDLKN
ncbi:hypothetical protein BB559_001944 [Furculomyces boomerangus]|uniref:4a-hydroxytetrahydrobiopterin dehydratase n=2 Tax=Harpellales TaxID=61421 RepID=A0A2T9YTH0_9FUNG|nr:hypothetical protein BB559_002660 [Furculomyces boomerangus]PVU97647.1 hypothetical protein BB559_001944 [Furculomyces boomerangus]PWA02776.1 hypothetical protein BB558_001084 [Smittium angustum]